MPRSPEDGGRPDRRRPSPPSRGSPGGGPPRAGSIGGAPWGGGSSSRAQREGVVTGVAGAESAFVVVGVAEGQIDHQVDGDHLAPHVDGESDGAGADGMEPQTTELVRERAAD